MAVTNAMTIPHDSVLKIRDIIASGIQLSGGVAIPCFTSYPERASSYPMITIAVNMGTSTRLGAYNVTGAEVPVFLKVQTWSKSRGTTDNIAGSVFGVLNNIQFSGTGTADYGMHDFQFINDLDIDEEGAQGVHRKVQMFKYLVVV